MKRLMSIVSCCLFASLVLVPILVNASEYDHDLKDKKITFSWKVDGKMLAVKLSAKTEGWVGIGFNPSQKMKEANYVLGYVKKGKAKIIDDYGDKENAHKSDKKLGGTVDALLVAGTEEDGVTTIEFKLPLRSEDKYDSNLNIDGETIVLLAFGGGRDSFKSKHKYRVTYKVNLGSGAFEKAK